MSPKEDIPNAGNEPLDTYSKRIRALKKDIARELDGEEKAILQERLEEVEAERDKYQQEIATTEKQDLPIAPEEQPNTPKDKNEAVKMPPLWGAEEEHTRTVPAIADWLKGNPRFKYDPFGPEKAEKEWHLPKFFVDPPDWDQIIASGPTIVVGAPGSGLTAARLLLARLACDPHKSGAFPVQLPSPLEKQPNTVDQQLYDLADAFIRANLDCLALNPSGFQQTPPAQQRALARLFSLCNERLGTPERYLKGAGMDEAVARQIAATISEAGEGTAPPERSNPADVINTLSQARPYPFDHTFVLQEISFVADPDDFRREYWLKIIEQIAGSLAQQKVFLKLFVCTNPEQSFTAPIRTVNLKWDEAGLQEIVETRFIAATGQSPSAVFFPPPAKNPAALLAKEAMKDAGAPRKLIQLGRKMLLENCHLLEEEKLNPQSPPSTGLHRGKDKS